jgi:hypothetical protein
MKLPGILVPVNRGIYPILLIIFALAGCTSSLNLRTETELPTPVVSRIPLTLGIYYDDNFKHYVYEEDTEDRPGWEIDNSPSRIALFNQIQKTTSVSGTSITDIPVDAIISPRVDEMQLALPQETRSGLYEAWVKYDIRLYQPDGSLIAEWPVTGYGKAEEAFLKSRNKGLNEAINLAMRDVGAKLALGFPRVAEVRAWLKSRTTCDEYSAVC